MAHGDGGKGDSQRPTDHAAFSSNWDLIWGKKKQPERPDARDIEFTKNLIKGLDEARDEARRKAGELLCKKENPSE